eukprot:scaffold2308_cov103-Cylindrotheca_fusiformis.AAC.10
MKISQLSLAIIPSVSAFAPRDVSFSRTRTTTLNAAALVKDDKKPIYDPLGLYPKDSLERKAGLIKPLETVPEPEKEVTDPLGIYGGDKSQVSDAVEMSASVPFLPRPAHLDGSLPGDRGFDPFNFSSDVNALEWYRKSEQKHGRIAMLAAVGWPIAELFHKSIAHSFDMEPLLASNDRVPSILNDGLAHVPFPAFWIPVIAATAAVELAESFTEEASSSIDNRNNPVGEKLRFAQEGEIFNGRLAMLAITGFAIQEFLLQSAVVDQIPIFFKPLNVAFEQLLMSS